MGDLNNRHLGRDSLLLLADLRLEGEDGEHKVKVRNLSPGGMMAEGGPRPLRGQRVSVCLRNIGWTDGVVAWVQDNRFGIAFVEDIDPKVARAPVGAGEGTPRFVKPPVALATSDQRLRKI